jgi:hypothetical protein
VGGVVKTGGRVENEGCVWREKGSDNGGVMQRVRSLWRIRRRDVISVENGVGFSRSTAESPRDWAQTDTQEPEVQRVKNTYLCHPPLPEMVLKVALREESQGGGKSGDGKPPMRLRIPAQVQ